MTTQQITPGIYAERSLGYFWNPNSLAYEVATTSGTGVGQEVKVTNVVAITAASLPLPTGAATETGHLATIDTSTARIPAQGQALAAASMPVVLPATQITTLTPPTTVTVQQPTGTNLHVVVDTAPSTAVTNAGTFAVQAAATLAAETTKVIGTVNLSAAQSVTSNQGTPNTVANGWPVKLTDGTNSAAFATGAGAASELTTDRLKVNAELRMLDTAQPAGSQIVAGRGDQTSGLWVNVKAATNAAQETGGALAAIYAYDQGAQFEILSAILRELRVNNYLLQNGLNVSDDLELIRAESFFQQVA